MMRARRFITKHKKRLTVVVIAISVLAAAFGLLAFVDHGFSLFAPNDYETNLYTEIFGVLFSVFVSVVIIGGWSYWRERQQLRTRLKREAGSRSHDIAISAVEWLSHENWLIGDKGVLKYANLDNANLQRARLVEANLEGAWLNQANLQKAELVFAQMQEVRLQHANLQSARLMYADMQRARLFGANMQYATLNGANFHGAEMQKTNLQNALMHRVDLQGANLSNANLLGAMLSDANLCGAVLPDGERYSDSIDMQKYTNPRHPDYHDYSETLRIEERLRNTY
ncbi:MAG: pentapeptide repeat-containing protein [Chloroflexi bacterium]|nr:pentapeptide repeat-containing protein [Chloroflexota bacterium]